MTATLLSSQRRVAKIVALIRLSISGPRMRLSVSPMQASNVIATCLAWSGGTKCMCGSTRSLARAAATHTAQPAATMNSRRCKCACPRKSRRSYAPAGEAAIGPHGEVIAGSAAVEGHVRVPHPVFLHQIVEHLGVVRMEPYAAMRGHVAQVLDVGGAMDRVAAVEEDRP